MTSWTGCSHNIDTIVHQIAYQYTHDFAQMILKMCFSSVVALLHGVTETYNRTWMNINTL